MSTMSTAGESIAYRVIIVSVLGPALAIPLCAIRVYTKLRILRNTGYDDYAIFCATVRTGNPEILREHPEVDSRHSF
jgi:hypothetical protein